MAHPHPERRSEGRAGSRRIFPPQFKLQVLEAYRRDAQCRGNQRATARKFGIHRRQIQKWLQAEPNLKAVMLRRAPQQASSPPPYSVGSPECARLPTPPPPAPLHAVKSLTPISVPSVLPATPSFSEPIDLSLRRPTPPPQYRELAPPTPEPQRKPFKLFRPYLLDDDVKEKRSPPRTPPTPPVALQAHFSAFMPVGSASAGCALACPTQRWYLPAPAFPAPLR